MLRFATVLAIAAWIGGLVALGAIAAPAIFEVVSLRQVPDARMVSGAIFGEILRRFHLVSYACGGLILVALAARAVLGPAAAALRGPFWPRRADARRRRSIPASSSRAASSACSTRSASASRRRACPLETRGGREFGRLHAPVEHDPARAAHRRRDI